MDNLEQLKARAFDASGEGIIIMDAQGRIAAVNRKFEEITGYAPAEILGQHTIALSAGRHEEDFYARMWDLVQEQGWWSGLVWNRRRTGDEYLEHFTISAIHAASGAIEAYIGVMRDITDQKLQEDRVKYLANHDVLTSLLNRHALDNRLERAIQHARRNGTHLALMFLDLDRFKQINDTLGHDAGDALLKAAAQRIRTCVRDDDTVARQGGDEFIVLLEDLGADNPTDVARMAQRIVDALSSEFFICSDCPVSVSVSIGIAIYPENGATQAELVKHADLAMYHAKASGRSCYQFFSADLDEKIRQTVALEGDLRAAIAADGSQFMLHYQPKINLATGNVVSLEALIRWNHPTLGRIPPGDFISLAEDAQLITPLCRWLVSEVAAQIARWGDDALPVAINISPAQFRSTRFVEDLLDTIRVHSVEPAMIELEITEGVFINDKENAIRTLQAARDAGFRVALDDFGTGYSSLNYLVSLPIDVLKIDRSFINDKDRACLAIVRFLVALGQELGVEIVAEGVESLDQARFLTNIGCNIGQGYLFSRPLQATDVLPFLHENDPCGDNELFSQGIQQGIFQTAEISQES
jgi:diguanylate cyclase (GGDEF)-like protein/PAS domain S-box-containing protein